MTDPDSGAHPLVHAAWRLLAIACQESGNVPRPEDSGSQKERVNLLERTIEAVIKTAPIGPISRGWLESKLAESRAYDVQ